MENIDDLMRQKFDSDDPGARFEFQEEYWEQAQALLEQDEARRRRRIWFVIGLLLGIALLVWLLLAQWGAGSLSQNRAEEKGLLGGDAPRQEVSSERPVPEKSPQANGVESSSATNAGIVKSENNQLSSITESSELQAVSAGESRQIKLENVENQDVKRFPRRRNTKEDNSQQSKKSAAVQHSKGLSNIELAYETDLFKNEAKNALNNSAPPITNPPVNPADAKALAGKNPPVTNPPITTPPITTPLITTPQAFIPISIIPTPLTIFELPKRTIVPRKLLSKPKEPIAEKIKPVQDQRFSFGLSLAGAAYQQSDTAGSWAGWTIGAFGNYRLNKNWSLMLGVQGRFMPGQGTATDSLNPKQAEQLRYSFGYRRESWTRETRGLYYFEMPLSARWHKGPWSLEIGGAAGTLFRVHDRTKYTVESSLEEAKTEIKKLVKGNNEPYNRTYLSAFAGADYQLNDRLSLMARGQYRFTPVFKTLGEGVQNKGLGNVELGVRFRLF